MDIIIKPFETENFLLLEKLCDIDYACFGKDNAWTVENFSKILPFKLNLSFVAYHNQVPIGFIICSVYKNKLLKIAHLNRIAVSKEYSKNNVGYSLIQKFEFAVRKISISKITLEFHKSLHVAHFYEKCGYIQITDSQEIEDYVIEKRKEDKLASFLAYNQKIYYKKL